ncbi:DUF2569 domain-containing protein [Pseudomonas sp. CGJS7]|uniref:DUF2569 domain-containing protein n=1 Tax=Pseudomonas sp. CGJS7 TaxID=3109348 RepID=UPI0030084110
MNPQESTPASQAAPRGPSPTGAAPASLAQHRAGPSGLGGWLIVVGVWLGLTALMMCGGWVQFFKAAQLPVAWQVLAGPETPPMLRAVAWSSLVELSLLSATSLIALYGFFRRARWFPRTLIGLVVAYVLLEAAIAVLGSAANATALNPKDLARVLAYPLLCALILTPYLLRSRRVRNTFVHPRMR